MQRQGESDAESADRVTPDTAGGMRPRSRGPRSPAAQPDLAMRRHIKELAQRYLPFLLVISVLLLLVLEAPTSRPNRASVGPGAGPAQGAAGQPFGTSAAKANGARSSAAGAAGVLSGSNGLSGSAGAGQAALGGAEYTVGGVRCGPGVLQVTWSPYAPPCAPAWRGNNGGSTARGVSPTTITLSYREEGESNDVNAVRSIMPGVLPTDSQVLYDLNVFLAAFNREFELYGRHVVIKPFMAQGDALQEMVGQDTQGAQEDAATAASLGSFADITPLPTQLYTQALVQNQVVSFNTLLASKQYLDSSAPYVYTVVPDLDLVGGVLDRAGCNLGAQAVSYADNSSLDGKRRVFGVIVPEQPQYQGFENNVVQGLRRCGVKVPVVINYSVDLSTMQQEMQNAVSQMKAAHVTTVVCGCDPVGEIYVTQAADQQSYGPEWVSEWLPVQFERLFSQDQWAHSVEVGLGPSIPQQQLEAYRVFKMVDPRGEPAEPFYYLLYYELEYVFNGLQAAGPDLTPATMLAGFQHLPASHVGQVGQWFYGPGIFWPFSEAQVSFWEPAKRNGYDGKAGDYGSCWSGQWFDVLAPSAFPPTLNCPGLP
jgi:hypothetical protein